MKSEASGRLDDLLRSVGEAGGKGPAPIERWNPPDCGDIDLGIDREGVWHYAGSPIGRPALVRLFASVLAREGERYVLVTPAEKVGITVADAPFLAVDMAVEPPEDGGRLVFRTNLDDLVRCDADHPLRFAPQPDAETVRPYIYVRRGLWARLTRAVFLELVERGEEREQEGRRVFGVASGTAFFPLMPADQQDGI